MAPPPAPKQVRLPTLRPLLPALFALAVCSCGSPTPPSNQVPTHQVRGKVLVNDKPAAGAFVLFVPAKEADPPTHPRPRATAADDGSFVLSTYGEDDGAPAGEYVIAVRWPADGRDDEDRLGGRYAEPGRSRLEAKVESGANDLPAFKLK